MSDNAQAAEHGRMDIHEQQGTFSHFLKFVEWGVVLVVQSVALLTVAFAMGYGWFAGLAAHVIIGVAAGIGMKMSGAWWAMLIALAIGLGVGGAIVALLV